MVTVPWAHSKAPRLCGRAISADVLVIHPIICLGYRLTTLVRRHVGTVDPVSDACHNSADIELRAAVRGSEQDGSDNSEMVSMVLHNIADVSHTHNRAAGDYHLLPAKSFAIEK